MRKTTSVLFSLLLFGCDGGGDDDDGVNPNDAGQQQQGDAGQQQQGDSGINNVTCDESFGQADACGGDFQGTWSYDSACGTTPVVSTIRGQCPGVTVVAERYNGGNGSLTITGSNLTLDVTVDVRVEVEVPANCVLGNCAATQAGLATAFPQATVSCNAAGTGCACSVDGPVGVATSGTVTSNGGIATVDGTDTYYFCVEGNAMTYGQFGTGADEPVYVLTK